MWRVFLTFRSAPARRFENPGHGGKAAPADMAERRGAVAVGDIHIETGCN